MAKMSVFIGEALEPSPIDSAASLFNAQHIHKKWSKRTSSEEMPLPPDPLLSPSQFARFEQVVLPHLDSAYNLARWLTGNEHDAEDVVQDAYPAPSNSSTVSAAVMPGPG